MRIGFKKADVKTGGQYHDLFYDHVIVEGRRIEKIGSYLAVEVNEDEISYSWLIANAANIKWENLGLYVEAPVSFKTVNVPAWLPHNTYVDENQDTQTHTFESWGGVVRESLDGTKIVLKVTTHGDINASALASLASLVDGNVNLTAMGVVQTRTLTQGVEYTAPEG